MSVRTRATNESPNISPSSRPAPDNGITNTNAPPALQRAFNLIEKNDLMAAVDLLRTAGRDVAVRNALGVCLMRAGRVEEAVAHFRTIVLMPGTVQERPEISDACKRNFATALLMKGLPSGALDVLANTRERDHPRARQIRESLRRWEKTLPWFRRLDWKWCRIDPPGSPVPIDFEPGEFDHDVVKRQFDEAEKSAWKLAV